MSDDIKVTDGTILEALNGKIDYDGGNYIGSGLEAIVNNYLAENAGSGLDGKITNCLLEVPQNIKLELADGTLTLKAGSIVTVPNGFEANGTTPKFDYVTIENDKRLTVSDSSSTLSSSGWFVFINPTSFSARNAVQGNVYSGTTAPDIGNSTYASWYDTANNLMKHTSDKGVTWVNNYASFPLCTLTRTSGIATSIDQVFNGIGYIGSIAWLDKGVKALIPNGRNADGSLNNIEWVNNTLLRADVTAWGTRPAGKLVWSNKFVSKFAFQNIERFTTATYSHQHKYNELDNKWYFTQDSGATWVEEQLAIFADDMAITSGAITKVDAKQPFRAVDYNDIAGLKAYITETYVNGTSWYRVYSDGWCEQGGIGTATKATAETQTITLLKAYKDTNYSIQISALLTADNITQLYFQTVSKNTNNFKAKSTYSGNAYNGTVSPNWYACGYIA